ncbi:hypothetical protein TeGR_g11028, partial [Tetraparma gracilis]
MRRIRVPNLYYDENRRAVFISDLARSEIKTASNDPSLHLISPRLYFDTCADTTLCPFRSLLHNVAKLDKVQHVDGSSGVSAACIESGSLLLRDAATKSVFSVPAIHAPSAPCILNAQVQLLMIKHGCIRDLPKMSATRAKGLSKCSCAGCMIAKITKVACPRSTGIKYPVPRKLVHLSMDRLLFDVPSFDGNLYAIVVVDLVTHYKWTYLLHTCTANEFQEKVLKPFSLVLKAHGKEAANFELPNDDESFLPLPTGDTNDVGVGAGIQIRCDNEGSWIDQASQLIALAGMAVSLNPQTPYSSNLMASSEVINRHLVEGTMASMIITNAPRNFWSTHFLAQTFMSNITLSMAHVPTAKRPVPKELQYKTPHQLHYGTTRSFRNLHIIGGPVIVFEPPPDRSKTIKNSRVAVFDGYDPLNERSFYVRFTDGAPGQQEHSLSVHDRLRSPNELFNERQHRADDETWTNVLISHMSAKERIQKELSHLHYLKSPQINGKFVDFAPHEYQDYPSTRDLPADERLRDLIQDSALNSICVPSICGCAEPCASNEPDVRAYMTAEAMAAADVIAEKTRNFATEEHPFKKAEQKKYNDSDWLELQQLFDRGAISGINIPYEDKKKAIKYKQADGTKTVLTPCVTMIVRKMKTLPIQKAKSRLVIDGGRLLRKYPN